MRIHAEINFLVSVELDCPDWSSYSREEKLAVLLEEAEKIMQSNKHATVIASCNDISIEDDR
jgi:hypothetical protein